MDTAATVGPHIRLNMFLSRWAEPATNQTSSVSIAVVYKSTVDISCAWPKAIDTAATVGSHMCTTAVSHATSQLQHYLYCGLG